MEKAEISKSKNKDVDNRISGNQESAFICVHLRLLEFIRVHSWFRDYDHF